ncbi:hypothetical protein [Zhengella mangrovi]|uniref:hypothetical protein n=1 Tax=Zhengella mangrovi TaxID=1982044 RepID=UPI00105473CA|nr:hypothetical protein [Zhengella mangrovi]
MADANRATGLTLITTYLSVNDPDYYLSLGPIKAAFPEASVIAAPETVELLTKKLPGKIEAWGPQLGENGRNRSKRR